MIKRLLGLSAVVLMVSCGGSEGTSEGTETDSTNVAIDSTETMEELVMIDGEDKGDYLLYGFTSITAEGTEIDAPTMLNTLAAEGAFEGKVKVGITEVCKKAGCWITFDDGNGGNIRVFFKDHFGIPTETALGTEAILYGRAVSDTLSVDFQKHLLDDAREAGEEVAQSEYDAIKSDKIETTFECDAILVAKQ